MAAIKVNMPPPAPPPQPAYTIELSHQEADGLLALLRAGVGAQLLCHLNLVNLLQALKEAGLFGSQSGSVENFAGLKPLY